MKLFIFLLSLISSSAFARFTMHYSFHYSTQATKDGTVKTDKETTFHKLTLGGSINAKDTIYLGWNINSWDMQSAYSNTDSSLQLLEMGPRLIWYLSNKNTYFLSFDWNPYVRGKRDVQGTKTDVSGSSTTFGFGYRFEISRRTGLGAGLYYHSVGIKEQTANETTNKVSDTITQVMPKLEFTVLF